MRCLAPQGAAQAYPMSQPPTCLRCPNTPVALFATIVTRHAAVVPARLEPWEVSRRDLGAEPIRSVIERLHRTGKLILHGGCAEDQLALFTENQGDDKCHGQREAVESDPCSDSSA